MHQAIEDVNKECLSLKNENETILCLEKTINDLNDQMVSLEKDQAADIEAKSNTGEEIKNIHDESNEK